jgi:outer membrane protein
MILSVKARILWAVALAGCAFAAAAADVKIGFVNTERVFREAVPAKRAQQQLERDTVTMTEAQRREKERQLADISRNFQRMQREVREDLNLRRNEELANVQQRATRIINQIAEQEKFDLIVQEAVFASSRIDITDKVIRALAQ